MDVVFNEQKPFFESHLQGEKNKVGEDETAAVLERKNSVFLEIFIPNNEEIVFEKETTGLSLISGGEISLQDKNYVVDQPTKELLVYTRKRPKSSKVPKTTQQQQSQSTSSIIPVQDQSNSGNIPHSYVFPTQTETPIESPLMTEPNTVQNIPSNNQNFPDLDIPIAIRKGARSYTNHPIARYLSYHRLSDNHKAFTSKISHLSIPRNIQEALECPKWKTAVMEEMSAFVKNGTWESVDLPRGKKIVGCKWVFTIKCKADGSIERHKARLVAKGFTQMHGLDYQETFAPVAKVNSIQILLSLAANLGWPLHQLDVKNVFLNGNFDEEVFMEPPPGFEQTIGKGKVCRLIKSLYGLKQSPRAWFERFGEVVKNLGFKQSQGDHTLFVKHSNEGKRAVLIVYNDDIILTRDDNGEIDKLKKLLALEFEIKDLWGSKIFSWHGICKI